MAFYKGGQKIEDLYCGSVKIGKLYKGSTLVYSSVKYYTFTINPTPSNATVKINNQTIKSVTVAEGTSISWSVSASGYKTQSGTLILTANTTKNVALAKAGPLYACYSVQGFLPSYYYVKTPVAANTYVYIHSTNVFTAASSSSELKIYSTSYKVETVSDTSLTIQHTTGTIPRYTAGDLYK